MLFLIFDDVIELEFGKYLCKVFIWKFHNCIVDRGFLTPYFMKTPLHYHPPFQILSKPPLPYRHQPPPHCSFCCLVSLAGWVITPHLMRHSMILWIYICKLWHLNTRRTLLCVLSSKVSSLLRSDTCGFLLVLWFGILHTNTHTKTHSKHRCQ